MSDSDFGGMLAVIGFILFVGFAAGMLVGGCAARDAERVEAMKVGAARWTADPTTGEARFVYGRAAP